MYTVQTGRIQIPDRTSCWIEYSPRFLILAQMVNRATRSSVSPTPVNISVCRLIKVTGGRKHSGAKTNHKNNYNSVSEEPNLLLDTGTTLLSIKWGITSLYIMIRTYTYFSWPIVSIQFCWLTYVQKLRSRAVRQLSSRIFSRHILKGSSSLKLIVLSQVRESWSSP